MKRRLFVERARGGGEEESRARERPVLVGGQVRALEREDGRMRRREQDSTRPKKTGELFQPGVLSRFVEVREHGNGKDHVERGGRKSGRRQRTDRLVTASQVPRAPRNRVCVGVHAGDLGLPELAGEEARDASATAAEVQDPKTLSGKAGPAQRGRDRPEGLLSDLEVFGPRTGPPDSPPQAGRRNVGPGKEIRAEVADPDRCLGQSRSQDPANASGKNAASERSDREGSTPGP